MPALTAASVSLSFLVKRLLRAQAIAYALTVGAGCAAGATALRWAGGRMRHALRAAAAAGCHALLKG